MTRMPLAAAIKNLVYPGSAIIAGKSPDGDCAITAFLITGLNTSGRSLMLVEGDNMLSVKPFNTAETADNCWPAVISDGSMMFIGNGHHVQELANAKANGQSVREVMSSLKCMKGNQPRISAACCFETGKSFINMEIVKQEENALMRHSFEYSGLSDGTAFLLTALSGSDYPFEPFSGDPVPVEINGSIFDVVADIWENLRPETRVSLWVKSTDLHTGQSISRIINRNR